MKKLSLNKKVIAQLDNPQRIYGGGDARVTHTEAFVSCVVKCGGGGEETGSNYMAACCLKVTDDTRCCEIIEPAETAQTNCCAIILP
jgi:hypothetical protein